MLHETRQVNLTQDANKEKKKPGKYSAKPCMEPELSRPKPNHYNLSATPPLPQEYELVRLIYFLNINLFRVSIEINLGCLFKTKVWRNRTVYTV